MLIDFCIKFREYSLSTRDFGTDEALKGFLEILAKYLKG